MTAFKCKMCGGSLEIQSNETVVECEYCGAKQTLPKLNDERRVNLYDRANHFRRNNEFDKASAIYEQILNEDGTDAEAYWSLVLCRYGIEYVEDPLSRKRVPTVNRAQFTSIFDDENYKLALKNADTYQRIIYEEEAKVINEIQKGILAISQKEEPFDVFICYKETDESGRRTRDSVLAQDLYYGLTEQGFKVFFARITLEDKLGTAYEPYIFAALNSAKVMVVLGTKAEFFNAVWVKNEWSRYLSLIKNGAKKTLIPAYKDMDPYDLPQEFSHLQAQDMSKLGFMQDLIRGINKIVDSQKPKTFAPVNQVNAAVGNSSENAITSPLLKRMWMFIEDGEWTSADEYCEKILDMEPECSKAYIGKLMSRAHIRTLQNLHKADFSSPEISKLYDKACKFSNPDEYELYKSQYNIYVEEHEREEARRRKEEERIRREEERRRQEEERRRQEEEASIVYCNKWIALILCYFLGLFGVHRFYEGDKKWGKIYLFTLGLCGYGWLFDLLRILVAPARYPKKNNKNINTTNSGSGSGCYVATCVYGSYDCPQVWTLRRYRDDTLGSTWYGRAFIRIYYAISPTLVKWFGETKWFKKMWKGKLDRMVKKLQDKGVEDTPYEDKEW